MKMLIRISTLLMMIPFFIGCNSKVVSDKPETISSKSTDLQKEPITELKLQTLMKETLALAEGVEVVMSRVEVPKNTTLPMHFHPGEEFAYILEGSGTLNLKGQEEIVVRAGEMGLVPFKHHHSFSALEEGAKILVFRVHEKGQPERVLVK